MWASIRKFMSFKGGTKKEFYDNYVNELDIKAREDIVEVSTNLMHLQAEIKQFKDTIDKISTQLPGQRKI